MITRVITIQPGSTSGWHAWQGGSATVYVVGGMASVYLADCVRRQKPVGSIYVERPGQVNVVRNETAQPVVLLMRFVLCVGATLVRIDQPHMGCAVA